jgi:hypothetical protein
VRARRSSRAVVTPQASPDPAVTAWVPIWNMGVQVTPRFTYGTTLPTSPADGDRHVLVDSATNPTYQWELRYNAGSSSGFKWEYVGGSPKLFSWDANGPLMNNPAFTTQSGWYWWINASGSVFPVPRAGDYNVRCKMWCTLASGGAQHSAIGAFAMSSAGTALISAGAAAQAYSWTTGHTTLYTAALIPGFAAGNYAGMAWTADTVANVAIHGCWVEIAPVRVS